MGFHIWKSIVNTRNITGNILNGLCINMYISHVTQKVSCQHLKGHCHVARPLCVSLGSCESWVPVKLPGERCHDCILMRCATCAVPFNKQKKWHARAKLCSPSGSIHNLTREDRWFETGAKEVIYVTLDEPSLNKGGGLQQHLYNVIFAFQ